MKCSTTMRILAILLALPLMALGAANDFIITQYNSGGTATAPRVLSPAGGSSFTTLAGFKTALGLGTADSPTFAAVTLSGLTTGRVPFVTTGGLLTSAATLTFNSGTGALSATTVAATNGVHSATATGTGGASYGAIAPITIYIKSVTILTAGQPADIATVTLPSGITRWRMVGIAASTSSNTVVAETAAGTLAGASVAVWTGASATGSQVTNAVTMPTAATAAASQALTAFSSSGSFTATTLYFNQTGNSANAGTCSFYLTLYPLP